ncbi:MAG: outer membrane beta-barrel protein [Bacteroidetes bacterium]|nr:outer membrane beta-barrel protein [Bacteroidota bacterium]
MRGKEHWEIRDSTGNFRSEDDKRYIGYLGIPVYYGYTYKKVNINLGVQTLFALQSVGKINGTFSQNSVSASYSSKMDKLDIADYDFEPRIGISFRINKLFSAEAVFCYGISNLLKSNALNDQ